MRHIEYYGFSHCPGAYNHNDDVSVTMLHYIMRGTLADQEKKKV